MPLPAFINEVFNWKTRIIEDQISLKLKDRYVSCSSSFYMMVILNYCYNNDKYQIFNFNYSSEIIFGKILNELIEW